VPAPGIHCHGCISVSLMVGYGNRPGFRWPSRGWTTVRLLDQCSSDESGATCVNWRGAMHLPPREASQGRPRPRSQRLPTVRSFLAPD